MLEGVGLCDGSGVGVSVEIGVGDGVGVGVGATGISGSEASRIGE